METIKAIEERRSIRSYTSKELDKETLEDIISCGRLAPSAKNRQPWFFVVLNNDTKNEVADLMEEHAKSISPNSENPTAKVIKEAPILILVFKEKEDNQIEDNYQLVGDLLSIGAAIQNMCLRARDLGLGSLWIRNIANVSEEVSILTGHQDLELVCALALGYPNEEPKQRPRKELKEIVEFYNKI